MTAIERPAGTPLKAAERWTSPRRRFSPSVRLLVVGGFGLLILTLAGVTIGAAVQVRKHQSELAQLDHHSRLATLLQTAEAQAAISAEMLQRYVDAGDASYIGEINTHANAAQQAIDAALAAGGPPGLDEVATSGAQLEQGAAQALALRQNGDQAGASKVLESLVPVFKTYRTNLEAMTSTEMAQVSDLRTQANNAGDQAFWLLVALGAGGVVLGLAVSFWIARTIIRPLGSLERTARRASQGDLSARAPGRGPAEFSHLGSVLNEMMAAIEERTTQLEDRNRELTDARMQAATDPLTGLGNHRSFHNTLREKAAVAAEACASLGLVIIDLDGFKGVNDSLGHLAGDDLLREVSRALAKVAGTENTFRYGGDELAVLVPGGETATLMPLAERLKGALETASTPDGHHVTASFGVACLPECAATPEELVYRADMAMYWAKSSGKNRVSSWADAQPAPREAGQRLARRVPGDEVAAFCDALAAKDPLTRAHTERCSAYTSELAVEMGLGEDEVATVRLASLLHDVGKLVVPDKVLQKPGPLTGPEMDVVKHHPVDGANMLSQVASAAGSLAVIRHHHEHFDGSGYPDGLAGDDIPLGARIVLVADAFDAMTSDRPYGAAMPVEAAVAELRRCSGSQFDPQVVEAFLRVIERGGLIAPLAMSRR